MQCKTCVPVLVCVSESSDVAIGSFRLLGIRGRAVTAAPALVTSVCRPARCGGVEIRLPGPARLALSLTTG